MLSGCTQIKTALLLRYLQAQWLHTHAAAEVKAGLPSCVLLYVPMIKQEGVCASLQQQQQHQVCTLVCWRSHEVDILP